MNTQNTTEEYSFILHKVKEITKEAGLCSSGALMKIIKGSTIDIKTLLTDLHKDGIAYVAYNYVTGPIEVLADLRMIAAVMLITGADPRNVAGSSVYDHLQNILKGVNNGATQAMCVHSGFLKDVCDKYIDTLSLGSNEGKCGIDKLNTKLFYQRISAPLHTLVKNDKDLTAVYKLAVTAFNIVNNPLLGEGRLKGMRLKNPEPNSTYNHFHRLACVMVNRYN